MSGLAPIRAPAAGPLSGAVVGPAAVQPPLGSAAAGVFGGIRWANQYGQPLATYRDRKGGRRSRKSHRRSRRRSRRNRR